MEDTLRGNMNREILFRGVLILVLMEILSEYISEDKYTEEIQSS